MTDKKRPDDAPDLGRPTKYKDEFCQRVMEIGKEGGDVSEMAVACGVTKKTLYNYAQSKSIFLHHLLLAQEHAEAFHSKRVRKGLDKPGAEFQAAANLKYMSQRFRGYRDALEVNLNPEPTDDEITMENGVKKYFEMLNKKD